MKKVKVETPWGTFKVKSSPHGSPRILETAKTHPEFVGIGLAETSEETWEKMVFVFKTQEGLDEFREYLKKRDPNNSKWWEMVWKVAAAKSDVPEVIRWIA